MFRRLIFDHAAICTSIAFAVTVSFYLTFLWRALRMKRKDIERFQNLPFNAESGDYKHDAKA